MRRLIVIINTVKIIGAALVVLGGAASAYILNSRAKSALMHVEGTISLLRYVKTQVDCYSMPIDKILSGCNVEMFSECGYSGTQKPQSLEELLSGCTSLEPVIYKTMRGFADEFGKSYRAEQVKLCDRYIDELSSFRADLSERLPVRRKLNSTLCLSGSAAIIILLI